MKIKFYCNFDTANVMTGKSVLYFHLVGPPCRSVLLTAAALGVDLELREIDLIKSEHLDPDFLKVRAFKKFSLSI